MRWRSLAALLSPGLRWQGVALLGLIGLGALAEFVTVGAVLPFLALLTQPGRVEAFLARHAGIAPEPGQAVLFGAAAFAALAAGAGGVKLLLSWTMQSFVHRLGAELAGQAYARVLSQPYAYHRRRHSSETLAMVQKVQMAIQGAFLPACLVLSAALQLALIFGLLALLDARTALGCAAGFGVLYLGITLVSRKRLQRNGQVAAAAQAARIQAIQEALGGIRNVLLDHTQPLHVARFEALERALRQAQAMNGFLASAPRYAMEAIGMAILALASVAVHRLPGGLVAALPVLGSFALGLQKMLPLTAGLYGNWSMLVGARPVLVALRGLLDLPAPPSPPAGPPLRFERTIRLEGVGFAYDASHPPVLREVDLVIPKGAVIGIIGRTGSGKSTLLDLVMGLLAPSSGRILVDDVPLDGATTPHWQKQVAHVPQTVFLSDASIAENIASTTSPARIDRALLRRAARAAAVEEFVARLPEGFETRIGEAGLRLSGGQRQRIALARALYARAGVLILDEATSALDTETERTVMRAIQALDQEVTVIIVAHRLATLADCEAIYRVEEGRMVPVNPATAPDAPGCHGSEAVA
ncbi:ATP-binding cassette domain-containing protein [Roseicella aquatilis]|nr:ABC transporter ATP-binding protein [Roseicella aquatilis]